MEIAEFTSILLSRLQLGFTTMPSLRLWFLAAAWAVGFAAIALAIGVPSGLLMLSPHHLTGRDGLLLGARVLLIPAVVEETVFRCLLLPHHTEAHSAIASGLWILASLTLYVAYHPLNAYLAYPAAANTFFRGDFLLLTTLLGIALTIVYWHSQSLWPPIVVHWVVVMTWLVWLGGLARLHPTSGG